MQQVQTIGFIQGNGNRGGRSIAVFMDIGKNFFRRQADAAGDCLDNPHIGLMRNEQLDLIQTEIVMPKGFQCHFRQAADCYFEEFIALHGNIVQFIIH